LGPHGGRGQDQRRGEQRAADLAEAERQRGILTQQLEAQQASQAEINARLEQQRQEQEAQAATRASNARTYATGRNSLIDQVSGAIGDAFGGFDDSYYDQYASKVLGAARPELDTQYKDDRRTARLALAGSGNLNSSAAARALGRVTEKYKAGLGAKSNEAEDAATRLRGEVENQKRSALSGLLNSAFIGDENLPDGITDVNSSLDAITGRLNTYVRDVTERVNTYMPLGGSGSVTAPTIRSPLTTALTGGGSSLSGGW
jgi:hypothetical protein